MNENIKRLLEFILCTVNYWQLSNLSINSKINDVNYNLICVIYSYIVNWHNISIMAVFTLID